MRKLSTIAATTLLALVISATAVAAGNGPPGVGFYVDGDPYRTVATPNDLSGTGAPAHSFDIIYALGNDANGAPLLNVAEAAPVTPTTTAVAGWCWPSNGTSRRSS